MALSFISRPTSISPGRFILPRGQRGSPFPGRFLLPRGQRGTSPSRALSFTSRPTRIPFDPLFYLAANEDLLFLGVLFYLAANEDLFWRFLLSRGQRASLALSFTSRPTRVPGAFFYLAANEDFLSRAFSFTLRPTRISFFPGVFFYLAANEDSLFITNFSSIWSFQ